MIRVFPVGNNVPLMVFGNAFRYRKSNAKATRKGSCFVCSVKPVKEFSQFNIIYIAVCVFYRDNRGMTFRIHRYINLSPGVTIFNRVIKKYGHQLL